MRIYDVTLPLFDGMPGYPGDPAVSVRPHCAIAQGDPCNTSLIALGSHAGTHIDAPRHFIDGAESVDQLALERLVGPARVAEVRVAGDIDAVALQGIITPRCRRLLLKTRNSARPLADRFAPGYAAFTAAAARLLAETGLLLIGLDGPSADPDHATDCPAHRTLLRAGVVIVENLDLAAVPPGEVELLCLPLRLVGLDGAPVRVLLRQKPGGSANPSRMRRAGHFRVTRSAQEAILLRSERSG
jgi:arylformamidase